MKAIISPAKKMVVDPDSLPCETTPIFLEQAQEIAGTLQKMPYDALKKLWKCNDAIAGQNFERLQTMNFERGLTPAILAYDGIQYRHIAPHVFSTEQLVYLQQHLRIISGLYGLLRPFDGVVPYRLEMQTKLSVNGSKDLYEFWGSRIAQALCAETDCIINLASKEYSVCLSKHLPPSVSFITCVFAEEIDGKLIEKGTKCKMARGEIVRYLAEQQITTPDSLKSFQGLQFTYSPAHSSETTYVFLQTSK